MEKFFYSTQIYDDAIREIDAIRQRMTLEFELPPLDFIG